MTRNSFLSISTRKLALSISLLLLLVASVYAQKRAFTIEDFYRIKGVSGIEISPDGKTVLYGVTTSDLARARRATRIWTMDIDGKNSKEITTQNAFSPHFLPDGRIIFQAVRDGNVQLFVMPQTGGEWKLLTTLSTGVGDYVISPDGKLVAFTSDVYPECNGNDACNKRISERWEKGALRAHLADELLYRHWTQWRDGKRAHTFLLNIESGAVRDLTPGNMDWPPFDVSGSIRATFSPDGKELALMSNHDKAQASSTNGDVWLLALTDANAKPRNITAANKAYDGTPKYSPDGKYIAYRLQRLPGYESDLFRLALYDRATGKSEVLTETYRDWIDDFEWSKDSKAIYFTGPFKGQVPIHRLDLTTRKITQVIADKSIDAFTFTDDEKKIFYIRRGIAEPAEIHSADITNGKAANNRQLTNINTAVANDVDIRPAEQMWIAGAGGAKIHTFIVKPHNFDPNKKYPLILNVHGGPQSQWADGFRGDWQVYPGAGYIVAFCNPHGSVGYGQAFTAQISGDWNGMVFQDLMLVTSALERLPYVDKTRMGAMGWSYGGYMMNWFAGHTTRFKAIASMMGLYNLKSFYGATEELWFPEWDAKGQPWNSRLYETMSPSNYVRNFKTPTLIITGERDYRVPYTQSLEFFTALQKRGVPSRLIVYPNAGHWPSWYEMALYYTAHLEWFQKYLGGGGAPWTTEAFLRNAVFDRETGKRYEDAETAKPESSMRRN
ncbi:MAG: S9 family peptidase [Acidobacteriota bacterium]